MLERSIEDFLNLKIERDQIDALGAHAAVRQIARVIVIAQRHGQGKLFGHRGLPPDGKNVDFG
jgi:hypothetical protein